VEAIPAVKPTREPETMTMIDGPCSMVIFREPYEAAPEDCADEAWAKDGTAEYFRLREQAERAAAKGATSIAARRVHQELAQIYAFLSQGHAA
jgi:hypothetical protein